MDKLPPKLLTLVVDRLDLLKHFAKDPPRWKLAALVVIKLPTLAVCCLLAYMHFQGKA